MTKKDFISKICFNLLKIWGASWLGLLLAWIPVHVVRFFISNTETDEMLIAFLSGSFTMIVLFIMAYRESYKEANVKCTIVQKVLIAIIPAIMHLLICIVTNGSVYVLVGPTYFANFLAEQNMEAVSATHVLLTCLIFDSAYIVSFLLANYFGKKKRIKDRKELCGTIDE